MVTCEFITVLNGIFDTYAEVLLGILGDGVEKVSVSNGEANQVSSSNDTDHVVSPCYK